LISWKKKGKNGIFCLFVTSFYDRVLN
jgi:hypothetical protein